MLAFSEKFPINNDGITCFKDSSGISNRSYREPPITGERSARASYFDRSKGSMEIERLEAILDCQAFVPVIAKIPPPDND
jgi:hypothetical protein